MSNKIVYFKSCSCMFGFSYPILSIDCFLMICGIEQTPTCFQRHTEEIRVIPAQASGTCPKSMDSPTQKLLGWDVKLFKKQYFISTTRMSVIGSILSLPFLYNYYEVGSKIYAKKVETGSVKITPSDAFRLFGTDFAVITMGLTSYFILKNKAGLNVIPRYLN